MIYKFIKKFQKFWIEIDNCDGISNNYTLFFIGTYLSPIIDVTKLINFSFFAFVKYIFFVSLILFMFLKDNYNFENIFLKVLGYKVYKVKVKGIDYMLLSKKIIRNTKTVKNVIRVFEYMLMEEEEIEK
ncbi:hypothetical protein [Streptobacillus felis]|uniref:hypothetical protein n=1 Tax=Streptobacillus felis TaxID=1384509 RepID=UPI0018D266D3|nr:hypothetical protein [Streptobacillus felis]